jgi:antitoxin component of MazEF toxin-antitoxin module
MFNISDMSNFPGDVMPQDKEEGIDIIFTRPRMEGGSLVLTIPKQICDKLRITKGSRLNLILYNSFVILKHREKIEYDEEPVPQILELLDGLFELFKEKKELERKRYSEESLDLATYDKRMTEIHKTIKETGSKIFVTLKGKERGPEILTFRAEFQDADEVLDTLSDLYEKHYK